MGKKRSSPRKRHNNSEAKSPSTDQQQQEVTTPTNKANTPTTEEDHQGKIIEENVSSLSKKQKQRVTQMQLRSRATGAIAKIDTGASLGSKKIVFSDNDDNDDDDQEPIPEESVPIETTEKEEEDDDDDESDVEQVVTSSMQRQQEEEEHRASAAASFLTKRNKKRKSKSAEDPTNKKTKETAKNSNMDDNSDDDDDGDLLLSDPSFFAQLQKDRVAAMALREKEEAEKLRLQKLKSRHKTFVVDDHDDDDDNLPAQRMVSVTEDSTLQVVALDEDDGEDEAFQSSFTFTPSATALKYSKSTLIPNGSDAIPGREDPKSKQRPHPTKTWNRSRRMNRFVKVPGQSSTSAPLFAAKQRRGGSTK